MVPPNKHPPLPLTALRGFEAVARTLSVEAAAEELNVTSSAVLHQIRQLEDIAGRKLVNREKNNVMLTPSGRTLFASTNKALTILRYAMTEMQLHQDDDALNILILKEANHQLIRDKINDFISRYADIPVNVTSQALVDDQTIASFSFVFSTFTMKSELFEFQRIHREELRPFCSPDFITRLKRKSTDGPPVRILSVEGLDDERDLVFSWLRSEGFDKCNTISFPTRHEAARAAIEGVGIAMIDHNSHQDELLDGLLLPAMNEGYSITKEYHLGCKKHSTRLARSFIKMFAKTSVR